jgi:integrase
MEINFTKRKIESLPTPKNSRALYHDTQVRGLVLTVQPTGERAFAWYRKVRRYPRWRMLGRFPDLTVELARGKAEEMNSRLAAGKDPFEDDGLTFGTVFDRYINEHLGVNAKRPEREMKGARAVGRHLASWAGLPLNQLRREDVTKVHESLKTRRGVFAANRTLQSLKAAINWAIEKNIFAGPNPAAGIGIFKEPKRKRFLEPKELPGLFKQLNSPDTSDDLRDFVNLALFTGARRSDISRMRWEEVCTTATGEQFWAIPDPKGDEPYNVPLIPPALRVLADRKRRAVAESKRLGNEKSAWVFPSATSKSGHLEDPKKAWHTLRKRAKIPDVRLHDLRRTLGSWQAAQGTSLLIIGKSLGHTAGSGATQIYSQLQLDPVRESIGGAVRAMLTAGRKRR